MMIIYDDHLGVIWEPSGSHLGVIWETVGSHLGAIWPPRRHQKAPRRHQEAPRRPGTSWSQNVSYHMRLRTKVMRVTTFACTGAT